MDLLLLFYCKLKNPGRRWDTLSLLFNGKRVLFSEIKL